MWHFLLSMWMKKKHSDDAVLHGIVPRNNQLRKIMHNGFFFTKSLNMIKGLKP